MKVLAVTSKMVDGQLIDVLEEIEIPEELLIPDNNNPQ